MIIEGFDTLDEFLEELGVKEEDIEGFTCSLAYYDDGGYSGDLFMVFEKDNLFYITHEAHCSCYGLDECYLTLDKGVDLNEAIKFFREKIENEEKLHLSDNTEITLRVYRDYFDYLAKWSPKE